MFFCPQCGAEFEESTNPETGSNMDDDVFSDELEDAISLDDSFHDGNDNLEKVTIEHATDGELDDNIVNMSDAVFPEIGLELPDSILSGMDDMEDNFARPYSAGNRNSPNLSTTQQKTSLRNEQIKNASKFS